MTTTEAISFFQKIGWKVDKIARGKYRLWKRGGELCEPWRKGKETDGIWTGRELTGLARDWPRNSMINKLTQEEDNSKNRAATRDAIKKGDFDKIPLNGKTAEGDRWNWD